MKIFSDIGGLLFKNNINDLISELKQDKFNNKIILNCLKKIPREIFIKKQFANICYKNIPLPIDCNQTTSQPYVIVYMMNCLTKMSLMV